MYLTATTWASSPRFWYYLNMKTGPIHSCTKYCERSVRFVYGIEFESALNMTNCKMRMLKCENTSITWRIHSEMQRESKMTCDLFFVLVYKITSDSQWFCEISNIHFVFRLCHFDWRINNVWFEVALYHFLGILSLVEIEKKTAKQNSYSKR